MWLLVGEAQFFFTFMFAKKLFKTINDQQIIVFIAIQGCREGGHGENDSGAHGLQEGRWLQWAHELERGPIEMTLRNQHVKPEDLFFFFLENT